MVESSQHTPARNGVDNRLRFAGLVRRYHVWPVNREQNVAEHTWHIMRIYLCLFGPPPTPVWTYMLLSDAGEMGSGDMPHHVKARDPELRRRINQVADEWLDRHPELVDKPPIDRQVTPQEALRVKICDLMEMYEFGWEEFYRGNQLAVPIINTTNDLLRLNGDLVGQLSPDEVAAVQRHMTLVAHLRS